MKVSIPDLLEQWHKLVEYAKKAFSFAKISYLVTWRKIFTAPRCKGQSNVLLVIRLLFTVPASNAKLERIFFKLKCVKNNFCCSLVFKHLENILRITEEGSSQGTFDPMTAINNWIIDKVRCGIQEKGPHSYKSHNLLK